MNNDKSTNNINGDDYNNNINNMINNTNNKIENTFNGNYYENNNTKPVIMQEYFINDKNNTEDS